MLLGQPAPGWATSFLSTNLSQSGPGWGTCAYFWPVIEPYDSPKTGRFFVGRCGRVGMCNSVGLAENLVLALKDSVQSGGKPPEGMDSVGDAISLLSLAVVSLHSPWMYALRDGLDHSGSEIAVQLGDGSGAQTCTLKQLWQETMPLLAAGVPPRCPSSNNQPKNATAVLVSAVEQSLSLDPSLRSQVLAWLDHGGAVELHRWAEETASIQCAYALQWSTPRTQVNMTYLNQTTSLVVRQVALCAVRLAAMLNSILDPKERPGLRLKEIEPIVFMFFSLAAGSAAAISLLIIRIKLVKYKNEKRK